jgi:hypothetical protein
MDLVESIRRIGGRAPAICLGILVGILGTAAVVNAQGGTAGEITACVVPTTGAEANVRIIGAGERCPAGTPVNWNVQGAAGPPGAATKVTPQDVAAALKPSYGVNAKTTAKNLAKNTKLGTPSIVKSKTLGGSYGWRGGYVECPASFPHAVTGGYLVKGVADWNVLANHGIYLAGWGGKAVDRWYVSVHRGPLEPGEPPYKSWTLKASVECAKKK